MRASDLPKNPARGIILWIDADAVVAINSRPTFDAGYDGGIFSNAGKGFNPASELAANIGFVHEAVAQLQYSSGCQLRHAGGCSSTAG